MYYTDNLFFRRGWADLGVKGRVFAFIVAACFGSPAGAGDDGPIDVHIQGRSVVSPGNVVRVTQGDIVVLRWRSDEAVELHLHGYDVRLELAADTPTDMKIHAVASGRFPVTSHGFGGHRHGHTTLLYLEVHPE